MKSSIEIKKQTLSAYNSCIDNLPKDLDYWSAHPLFLIHYMNYNEWFDEREQFHPFKPEEIIDFIYDNPNLALLGVRQFYSILKCDDEPTSYVDLKDSFSEIFKNEKHYIITPIYNELHEIVNIQIALSRPGIGFMQGVRAAMAINGYVNDYCFKRVDSNHIINHPYSDAVFIFQFSPTRDYKKKLNEVLKEITLDNLPTYQVDKIAPEDKDKPTQKFFDENMFIKKKIYGPVIVGDSLEDFNFDLFDIDYLLNKIDVRICEYEMPDACTLNLINSVWESGKEHKFWKPLYIHHRPFIFY